MTAEPATSPESADVATDDRSALAEPATDRLWQLLLHEENAVIQRGNFFLVAESLLVVGYSSLVAAVQVSPHPASDALSIGVAVRAIAGFGLLLTVVWVYVGRLQLERRRYVRAKCVEHFVEYRDFATNRRKGRYGVSGLMTFVTPFLAALMWITLLTLV
jgi:hypothetical protein